jgi:hypothetical protein
MVGAGQGIGHGQSGAILRAKRQIAHERVLKAIHPLEPVKYRDWQKNWRWTKLFQSLLAEILLMG